MPKLRRPVLSPTVQTACEDAVRQGYDAPTIAAFADEAALEVGLRSDDRLEEATRFQSPAVARALWLPINCPVDMVILARWSPDHALVAQTYGNGIFGLGGLAGMTPEESMENVESVHQSRPKAVSDLRVALGLCSKLGCPRARRSRGLCPAHRQAASRAGEEPEAPARLVAVASIEVRLDAATDAALKAESARTGESRYAVAQRWLREFAQRSK